MSCAHRGRLPGGACEDCGQETCRFEVDGCRCAVGWPYDLQCEHCRDMKNRIDQGYRACVPSRLPPRPAAPQSMIRFPESSETTFRAFS